MGLLELRSLLKTGSLLDIHSHLGEHHTRQAAACCREKDEEDGVVALHVAVSDEALADEHATSAIIFAKMKLIWEAYPEAVYVKDSTGQTPLHTAAASAVPPVVLEFLLDKVDPLTLWSVRDDNGHLPLHLSITNRRSRKAYLLLKQLSQQPTPVVDAILAGGTNQKRADLSPGKPLPPPINASPTSVLQTAQRMESMVEVDGEERDLPLLHLACKYHASRKCLRYILETFPTTVSYQDATDRRALIVALEASLSPEKIDMLVQADEESVRLSTGDGDVPLHLAVLYYEDPEHLLAVTQTLLEAWPDAVQQVNQYQQRPLHCALDESVSSIQLEVLRHLHDEDSLAAADCDGELPLHWACRHAAVTKEVIEWMIEHYPAALQHQSCHGHVPLHVAASNVSCSNDILSFLIQSYPQAALQLDSDGDTPLHCALTNAEVAPECIDTLLSACPTAASLRNAAQQLPLHVACLHKVSASVIRLLVRELRQAANERESAGCLPLHVAVLQRCGPAVMETLIKAARPAGHLPDYHGVPPLFLAAAVADSESETTRDGEVSLDSVYFLMKHSLELFEEYSRR